MENRALQRGKIYNICKDLQLVTECNKLVLFFYYSFQQQATILKKIGKQRIEKNIMLQSLMNWHTIRNKLLDKPLERRIFLYYKCNLLKVSVFDGHNQVASCSVQQCDICHNISSSRTLCSFPNYLQCLVKFHQLKNIKIIKLYD